MATYEELRDQYGLSKPKSGSSGGSEYSKLRQEYGLTGQPGKTASYNDMRAQYGLTRVEDNPEEYINSYFRNVDQFYRSGIDRFNSLGVGDAAGSYKDFRDTASQYRIQENNIRYYLKNNEANIDPTAYDSILAELDSYGSGISKLQDQYREIADYYNQLGSEGDYLKWDAYRTPEGRQARYQENKRRLEELREERKEAAGSTSIWSVMGFSDSSLPINTQTGTNSRLQEIDDEIAAIETEMRMYENGETNGDGIYYGSKVIDDYSFLRGNADFGSVSANRTYNIPTREELDAYDVSQSDIGRELAAGAYDYDEQGNIIDRLGNIVQDADYQGPSIEDKLGLFLSASDEDITDAYNLLDSGYETTWADLLQEGDVNRWRFLEPEEVEIYYYLLGSQGQEAAYKYLDDMEIELGRREIIQDRKVIDNAGFWEKAGYNLLSFPMNLVGGAASTIDSASRFLTGRQYNPYSRAQTATQLGGYIRGSTAQDIDELTGGAEIPGLGYSVGDAYQSVMSMVDSLIGARLGGKGYQAIMSMGAAANEANKLYSQGASSDQIAAGAVAAGVAEWIFEKYSIENLISMKSPQTILQFVKNALTQGGIEFSEEALTEIANIVSNGIIMQSQSDWANVLEENGGDYGKAIGQMAIQVTNAGISGFLSGFGSGAIQQGIAYGTQQKQNGQIGQYIYGGNGTDALMNLALDMAKRSDGKSQARLLSQVDSLNGKNFLTQSGRNRAAGRLYNTVRSVMTEQNIDEISAALQEQGFSKKDASKIAGALAMNYNGIEMTPQQEKLVQKYGNDQKVLDAISKVVENGESGIRQRANSLARFDFETMLGNVASPDVQRITNRLIRDGVAEQEAAETARKLAEAGKIYGKQADDFTNAYLKGQSVEQYRMAFANIYQAGKDGASRELIKNYGQGLTETQKEIAYLAGQKAGENNKAMQSIQEDDTLDVNAEGKTIRTDTNEDIEPTGFESVGKNGTLSTKGGQSVSIRSVAFASYDDAVLYNTIAKVSSSANIANTLLRQFREQDSLSAIDFAAGLMEAYEAGQIGDKTALELKDAEFAGKLTTGQREAVYNRGKRAAHQEAYQRQQNVKKKSGGKKEGKLHFDRKGRKFDSVRESSLAVMDTLSKALGVDIYVYESYVNEQGSRVYLSDRGEKKAPNGYYDPSDGSIHIDLNAGQSGEGTMLFTVAHELTHFIKDWSSVKYMALADALVKQYQKHGVTVSELVDNQIEKAKLNGREMSRPEAFDEMVADSMESMLTDENAAAFLEKIAKRDKGLKEKIVSWLKDLAVKLKNAISAYKDVKPDSPEGKMVAQMEDFRKEIMGIYTSALVDAGENFRENGGTLTSDVGYLNRKSIDEVGLSVDDKTDSVAPSVVLSERTWTESDYVQERDAAAKEIAKAIGVSEKKAKEYIDSVNSIAKMIADDRTRLDYFSSPGRSSFVSNVEYGGSFDFSTLCKKRRLLTGTFTAIQKALPNTALTANEILEIRNRMKEAGLEVSCGLCYVEGSRANMGQFAKEFLRLYKQYYPDSWQPNMADVNTPDGIEWVRINHPEVYEQYEYFWNHYGKLKPDDKNLFASQQKPKLYQLHTEYNGEILKYFKNDNKVEEKNKNGGIRLQSFSDFEIVHLIDTMQIIMDMARVGLAGQAYTKVPDFAWALGDTGLKINLSLIAKGVDQNGKLIFDDVEGMRLEDAMRLRSRYSENVGTILVVFNDEQLYAAMADDRIDFIIPFHRSQWEKSQYSAMGLPSNTKDYTYMQNEKYIRPQYHEYRGKMVRDKATNYMPNEYWDFGKTGKENAEAYLELCARNNKRPKFYKLLQNNGDGSYSLKDDGSTDGYWKLLIDFKMYDNEGNGSPQISVKPDFNMEESRRMLDDYRGGHSSFPVANGIVEQFVSEYKESHKGIQFSDRDPTAEATRAALEKENGKLREDVSRLRELLRLQGKVTGGTVMKPSSVEAAARWLNKYAGANADVKELSRMLTEFYRFIATDKDYSWEDVHERAMDIAKYLQDNVQIKPQMSDYARDVLRDIRGIKITMDESQRAEVEHLYGSYEAFRKAAFGNVTFVKEGGISLDTMWNEWATLFPGTFDSEITASDQPQALMDAIDALRNSDTTVMEYAYNRESIAQELAVAVYDSYWRVDALKTVADRDQRKINDLTAKREELKGTISEKNAQIKKLRSEHRTEMGNLKKERDKTVAELKQKRQDDMKKLRTDYRKKLEDTRTRYQESREKAVDSRNRAKMREQVKKTVNELNHLLLDGDKKRHVPESMRKAVAEILSAVNMETSTAESRSAAFELTVARYNQRIKLENDPAERARLEAARDAYIGKGDQFKAKIDALAKAYEDIKNSADPGLQDAYSDAVSQYLFTLEARVGDTRLGDMTLDQLKTVQEVLRIVLSTIRNANRSFLNERAGTIEQQAKRCISEVSSVWGKKKEGESDVGRWLRGFHYRNLKPIYLMRAIGSNALTEAYNNLRRGEDTWYRDIQGGREYFLSQSGKHGYGKWDREKTTTFTDDSGGKVKLTLGQIMSLYAYSKQGDDTSEHLRLGGVVPEGEAVKVNKLGIKIKYHLNDATPHQLGPETLAEIIGTLTKEQRAFADEMQDYLSTVMADKGNEVSLAMYGIKLFTKNDYFPIKSAKQYVNQKNEPVGEVKLKNSGFTNKRKPESNNPIILRDFMDVWADHVNEMSNYHAFVLAIEDFNRIINYQTARKEEIAPLSLEQTIQSYMGQEAVSAVRELIQSVNGGARVDPAATFVSKAINLFKKNAVFASASVVIQQPSAIVRAAALIDSKYFVGKTIDREKVGPTWDIIKKYAPVAGIKDMGYFDTNMGKSTVDYIKGPEHDGVKDVLTGIVKREEGSFDELLSMAPGYADKVTWCAIWEAVKRETAAKNPKLATRSEEFLKICGERFTEVITHTQVYDSVFSRSGNMRSKDKLMGMATSFMAEPTTAINMIYDAVLQGTRGDKAYMRRAIGAVIGAAVLNAVLKSIVYAERDEDDDETYGEKYVSALVAALKDDVLLLVPNSIPFVRDIMSIVQGYSVERIDMELADDLISAVKKLYSDKATGGEKILGILGSFGNLLFPAKNMIREVKALVNVIDTFRNSESKTAMGIRNAVREGWSGKTVSNARQLYEARMAGDTAHEERIAARYENEKSANSAVVSAIKEAFMDGDLSDAEARKHLILYGNTDAGDAYWKVKEWIYAKDKGTTDGYGKYNDLYDAILNGGDIQAAVEEFTENGYDEDEVMSNVKTQVGRWFWDEESETRISAEQASDILEKYFGMKQGEIRETILKWSMKKDTGISFDGLREAYLEQIVSESDALRYLQEYGGMTEYDSRERVDDWSFEQEHGYAYDDIKSTYLDDEITRAEAIAVMTEIGGKSREDAEKKVAYWDYEEKTGVDYENKAQQYKRGIITRQQLRQALIDLGEKSGEDADIQIEAYDWEQDGLQGASFSRVKNWHKYCEGVGVDKQMWLKIALFSARTENDVGSNGKPIRYSAMKKVMAEIDKLPISKDQKTAIARAIGWSEKNIARYKPW